jgi:hypothetical protein
MSEEGREGPFEPRDEARGRRCGEFPHARRANSFTVRQTAGFGRRNIGRRMPSLLAITDNGLGRSVCKPACWASYRCLYKCQIPALEVGPLLTCLIQSSICAVESTWSADPLEGLQWLALLVQCLAAPPGKRALPQLGVECPALVLLGDRRKADDLPILLRQHVANQIVPRVKPEGRLSCSRCMIRMMAPFSLSLRRL